MTVSPTTRTSVPDAAERARSIAARGGTARSGTATLLPGSGCGRTTPLLHHVEGDGVTLVLVEDDNPLVRASATAPRRELPTMLEITDQAPIDLREPVRGLLWITGWLCPMPAGLQRAAALRIAELQPDPRLLDVGHGSTLLRLRPASLVLADGEGTESVEPARFAAAEPDPFCSMEAGWLRHLEESHADVVGQLMRHIPARLRRADARIRPLGVDRLGLRLRVELPDGTSGPDTDVRLRFTRPVDDVRKLSQEIRLLLGCPFLRAQRH